ncbi:MAG: CoB--CoM heterodisulfide reductase iron-sulfur subunit A family protein [Thermoplasmata archaeon]
MAGVPEGERGGGATPGGSGNAGALGAPRDKVGAVLVVGGGIAGMQASLDLADAGFKVYLLDNKPSIGGVMAQLDKTFPTNDCSMCIMAPKLVGVGRHHNIEVITNAELLDAEGSAGNFRVRIARHPRYIDPSKCTGCGTCAQECPVEAIDEYNEGMTERAAISVRYPQAVPLVYSIDKNRCIGCGSCEYACRARAIRYDDRTKEEALDVGAIILCPGFEVYRPRPGNPYGYGVFKNVVTSMEFERILSATGPYAGHVMRPSDGKEPESVAFIQCVGSRDQRSNLYCSAVCCMYATKEAIIAQEHARGLRATIFFMDMRAFGKEFDYYYKRAQEEYGIRYVRSRAPSVSELPDGGLKIKYEDENGEMREETFDMVVLSVGLCPPRGLEELAARLKVKLNQDGFVDTTMASPLCTNVPGIFVCGVAQSPKDIPDTVAQASGAAALAASVIAPARGTRVSPKEYPQELDVSGEEPRIGVFVCHCGINIGGVVDVPSVVEYARTLPNVVYAENNLYTCSDDTQKRIKEKIKEHRLNRVVVASCTPRTHEPLFMDTCREAGLNPYLFEMANIRDQCSWVHMNEPKKATKKAKDLVRMAVAKARKHVPLKKGTLPVKQSALVVGGGLAGMAAAHNLAEQGFEVHLVEREKELGGNLRRSRFLLSKKDDPRAILKEFIGKVTGHPRIKVHLATEIRGLEGFIGNFRTTLGPAEGSSHVEEVVEHGVVIVATGGVEYVPTEYHYGKDPRIVTQRQLEELLADGKFKGKNVVMIQCVGSRDEKNPSCSRICCGQAIKNALKVRELSPSTSVYVLYKDIRTYGFREEYYREASEKGVVFLRWDDSAKPEVTLGKELRVRVRDPLLGRDMSIPADWLVLSAAVRPAPTNPRISELLKVPLNRDGFFLEAHMKLRPVDFATEGVFLCGMAHGPKFIDEALSQAYGAASRAATVLSRDTLEIEPTISTVIDANCDGCAYCVDPCPFKAITLVEYEKDGQTKKTVRVNEALCKGCGCCMATCPKKGIYVKRFSLEQLSDMVDAALESPEVE